MAHEGCMFSRLRAAVAAAGDRRIWAVDASAGNGGAAPKFYIVAEPTAFATAYLRVRMEERHAYEVIDEGCWIHAFFDLDAPAVTALDLENGSAAANRVVTAAVAALAELAALREPGRLPLEVDVLVLDATRPVGTEGACDRYIIDSNRFFHVRHVRQLTSGATERYFSHMRHVSQAHKGASDRYQFQAEAGGQVGQVSRAHVRPGDRYFSPARRVERVDADGWRTSARGPSRHASHARLVSNRRVQNSVFSPAPRVGPTRASRGCKPICEGVARVDSTRGARGSRANFGNYTPSRCRPPAPHVVARVTVSRSWPLHHVTESGILTAPKR